MARIRHNELAFLATVGMLGLSREELLEKYPAPEKPAKKLRTGVKSLSQYDLRGTDGMNRQQRRKHERFLKKRLMREIDK